MPDAAVFNAEQQRMAALALANHVRVSNGALLREIREAGRRRGLGIIVGLLEDPVAGPPAQIPVHRILRAVQWMGPTRTQRLLYGAGIMSGDRRLGQLTTRQRDELRFGLRLVIHDQRLSS